MWDILAGNTRHTITTPFITHATTIEKELTVIRAYVLCNFRLACAIAIPQTFLPGSLLVNRFLLTWLKIHAFQSIFVTIFPQKMSCFADMHVTSLVLLSQDLSLPHFSFLSLKNLGSYFINTLLPFLLTSSIRSVLV